MTIKEFAHICGCNPQTLRYYDQIDLLKPVKVDRWSEYRYYDEEQTMSLSMKSMTGVISRILLMNFIILKMGRNTHCLSV